MSSSSLFNQSATYFPANTWVLPANIATTPAKSLWTNGGGFDQSTVEQSNNAAMPGSNGVLVAPYSSRYDVSVTIAATDFPSFTSGTMVVSLIYTPKGSSPGVPYIMASGSLSAGSTIPLNLENRVLANSPDEIAITFTPTMSISDTMNGPSSVMQITDVASDPTDLQFYGTSGKPPTYARLASIDYYQTAPVINGVATFILTQSGEATGASLFKQVIGMWLTAQSPTATTTNSVGVPAVSLDPLPTNFKTATAHVGVGGSVPGTGWTVLAQIKGY